MHCICGHQPRFGHDAYDPYYHLVGYGFAGIQGIGMVSALRMVVWYVLPFPWLDALLLTSRMATG